MLSLAEGSISRVRLFRSTSFSMRSVSATRSTSCTEGWKKWEVGRGKREERDAKTM
jgi:hypothetical protein